MDRRDDDIWRNLSWGVHPQVNTDKHIQESKITSCNMHPFQELGNRKLQEELQKGLFRSLACPESDREWKHNDYEFE